MNGTIALQFEVTLVNPKTGARCPSAGALLSMLSPSHCIDPGLTHSTVRVTTAACRTLEALEDELHELLEQVELAGHMLGVEPVLSAVHPTAGLESPWWTAATARAGSAAYRWVQHRVMTSGATVIIRPESPQLLTPGGLAVELPMLLALSASSPFWEGRQTGFASTRAAVLYGERLGESAFDWAEPRWTQEEGEPVTERTLSRMVTMKRGRGVDLHIADLPSRPADLVALASYAQLLVVRPLAVAVNEVTLERNLWRAARAGHHARFEVPLEAELVGLAEWVDMRAETAPLDSPRREALVRLAQRGAGAPRLVHAWRVGADGRGLVRLMRRDLHERSSAEESN